MTQTLYNVSFVTDRAILTTTVEAEDDTDAHNKGLEAINDNLGLNLIEVRYQIEVEKA